MQTKQYARAKAASAVRGRRGMPAINEHLKVDQSIAAQQARAAGINQTVVLPLIENALLKAVLAWYL